MVRIERFAGATVVVSRLGRPHVVAILAAALAAPALLLARTTPGLAAALGASAALMAVLGGRAWRTRFERGRVRVRPAVPFQPGADRSLAEFACARVETVAEARRRRAERMARDWRDRSGLDLPSWMSRSDAPGVNDHLRRVVLVHGAGERLAITAWLSEDLESARAEIEALLR